MATIFSDRELASRGAPNSLANGLGLAGALGRNGDAGDGGSSKTKLSFGLRLGEVPGEGSNAVIERGTLVPRCLGGV